MQHSKQKGNLGSSAVLKELHKLGYNVFAEIGDNSKIDYIVETPTKLIRLQVKYISLAKKGTINITLKKSGPNGYRYTYSKNDVDLFAVYCPELDKVIFVPMSTLIAGKTLDIRVLPAKNGQQKNIHTINEFEDLQKILDSV